MTGKTVKKLRKRLMNKYSGEALSGYEHLDDGSGDYARNVPDESEKKTERKIKGNIWVGLVF